MRIEKKDGSAERRILTAMVVDKTVLGRISSKWERELFRSSWANLVAGWCVKFFNKYGYPPAKDIEGLFESWATESKDKDSIKLIEKFLQGLSDEYESLEGEINSQYVIDEAGAYFTRVRLEKLKEAIQGDLDSGELEKAEGRVSKFSRIEMGMGSTIEPFKDMDAVRTAFKEKGEPLIVYPHALLHFFGEALERDAFIAFEGPEKRGKTWWLIDLAFRGMQQRRKVAFFEVGDMSQNQIMRRFMTRAARRPLKAKTIKYPLDISKNSDDNFAEVDFEERSFKHHMKWQDAWKACTQVIKKTRSKDPLLRLSCYPNSTISVFGIQSVLQNWERQGWVPDVVVCDYADILAPPPGITEERQFINTTWATMRSISQSFHCLMVTATQTDAASYNVHTLGRSNFSGDKRKLAHVNGMVGLNATAGEKEKGITRLNWVVLREDENIEGRCVHVAGCLGIGNPAIKSIF